MTKPFVLVIHSDVPADAPPDDQDTLHAARMVTDALAERGYRARALPFSPSLSETRTLLQKVRPDAVFNLVESVEGRCKLLAIAPQFFEACGVPYTGCSAEALFVTGDKVLSKRLMRGARIPTPDWWEPPFDGLPRGRRVIVKHRFEDASLGLDADAVVVGPEQARARADAMRARYGGAWFAEAYVDGREFNVSVVEDRSGPRVLPIPEMTFDGFADGAPKILCYAAKWVDDAGVYHSTQRAWPELDPGLLAGLQVIAERCWTLFELAGAARVDLRVDAKGRPFVLEVNANPGIGPEGGLQAACAQEEISYADLVELLVERALARGRR